MPVRALPEPVEVIAAFRRLLSAMGSATAQVGGSLGFRVHGARGGEWVVDLTTPGGAWSHPPAPGAFASCQTRLHAFAHALPALLGEPSRLRGLMETRELVVEGDRQAFLRLSRMLPSVPTSSTRPAGVWWSSQE